MARSPEAQALLERLDRLYQNAQSEVMHEVERAACGCDYGSTSWATQSEVDGLIGRLGLGPGTRLLEVGAGSGWPGLYWATKTGCDVVLADIPFKGLRIAAERAERDRPSGHCWVVAADATDLPLRDGWFDAVSHSDVLCCLDPKRAALEACRRVVRDEGTMAFTVISITPNLSPTDHARAVESGPPFVETATDYSTMLRQSGWRITERRDLRASFIDTTRCLLQEREARADRLTAVLGATEFTRILAETRSRLEATERGHLRRELFVATAVSEDPVPDTTRIWKKPGG